MIDIVRHAAIWLPIAATALLLMELWAALLHRRIWHRRLWPVHRTHHRSRTGRFETNDLLSALHAPVAVALVLYGCVGRSGAGRELLFGIGVGMSVFGAMYFVLHDGLVHGRLPVSGLLRLRWLRRIVRAHRVHHLSLRGGAPFGFFFGPWELRRVRTIKGSRVAKTPR
ncbi:MAG: sterol desaturase family protein [Myxococcota bacterium]|nr:sterol desaturase family protein [Myxococcota bacterium]